MGDVKMVDYSEVKEEIGIDDSKNDTETKRLKRLFEVAKIVCELFAPDAPPEILQEAVRRLTSYLNDVDGSWNFDRLNMGEFKVNFRKGRTEVWAFKRSGARSLLAPFHQVEAMRI